MKYLYNPATDEFESLTPTLRDRFALGGRVNFSKGGSAELTKLLNLLPDGTKVTRDIVQKLIDDNNLDITVTNYFAKPSKNLKTGISLDKRMSPIKVTDELLDKVDNYIKNTPLDLKAIGEELGYKPTKKGQGGQLRSTSPLINAYEAKYGKISEDRFKPYKLDANSNYVKRVINLRERLGSTQAVAVDLGLENKTIRNVLRQFRPDLMGEANVPGPDTGAKAQKKRRILKEKEGTRQLSDTEKLFNKEQEKVVKDLNNDFKKNPSKVLNNSKLINLLNLKLEKGNIISKNKTKKQILESINRQGGLLDIEHIDDIATGKKNIQYPVNRQITTYNVNSGFLRSVANYVNGPDADPAKIANIEKTLKQYGLRVKTNKGIIGAEMIGAKDNVKRNLDAAGIKYDNVVKPPQSLTKKGLKFALKQIPLASFLIGTADAATAFKQGVRNPIDLYAAYEVSPEVALKSKAMREDKTGKLLAEEMSNLPDISAEASLMDDLTPYGKFLQEGGQLSFEEFQKMQSIPQSDRPLTGELDLPEMDQTMMAAQGGRVGFQDGSPDPRFGQILSAFENTDLIDMLEKENEPSLKEEIFGNEGERSAVQRLYETFNPKAFPYYAAKLTKGLTLAPEFAGRFTLAAPKALAELAQGKKGVGAEFAENIDPKVTQKQVVEKFGLQKIIDDMEENVTGSQKTSGDLFKMIGESVGPATGLGYFASAGKAATKAVKQIKKYAGGAEAAKELEKSIEEKAASLQMSRREFNTLLAGGGIIGLVRALGLDTLFPAAKQIAKKAAPEIVTKGGTPKYFFDFVSLIKSKGDDITEKASTLERQKVYDYKGYTMYEDISSGEIRINKQNEGVGSGYNKDGEREIFDTITGQEEIMYKPSETIVGKDGKAVKTLDEYEEATAKPDSYGDMEGEAGLDSLDEILDLLSKDGKTYSKTQLQEMGINPEALGNYPTGAGSYRFEDVVKPKKAGGGIMKMAGDDSGPPPKSGPTPHGLPYVAKNVRPIKERK